MIYGYYLIGEGGVPLLEEEFIGGVSRGEAGLFTSALSAIKSLIEESMKEEIRSLKLENAYIYLGAHNDLMLVVISDREDPSIEHTIDVIIKKLSEKFSADTIAIDNKVREQVRKIIVGELLRAEKILPEIKKHINSIIAVIKAEPRKFELPKIDRKKNVLEISVSGKISSFFVDELDINSIIEYITQGDFKKAYEAMYLYADSLKWQEKALMIWLGVMLNRYGLMIPAPDLSFLYKITSKVENEYIRKYLQDLIASFNEVTNFKNRFTLRDLDLRELDEPLRLVLLDSYNRRVLEYITSLRLKSTILDGLIKLGKLLIGETKRKELTEWLSMIGEAKIGIINAKKNKKFIEFAVLKYIDCVLQGFSVDTMTFELYKEFIKEAKKNIDLDASYLDQVYVPAMILIKALESIYLDFILDLAEPEMKLNLSDVKHMIDRDLYILAYLNELNRLNRIEKALYYLGAAVLINHIAATSYKLGWLSTQLLDMLLKIINDDMEEISEINPFIFTTYITAIIDTLALFVDKIPVNVLKRNIFETLGTMLERISELLKEGTFLHIITKLKAVDLYFKASTDSSLTRAREVTNEIRSVSPLANFFVEKLFGRKFKEGIRIVKSKIAIIGDPAVGKTSITMRYLKRGFSTSYVPTLGVDIFRKDVVYIDQNHREVLVQWQIWDIAGQKKWKDLQGDVYIDCDGLVLVYDVSRLDTFNNIKKWLAEARKYNKKAEIILVANKIDLREGVPTISKEKGLRLKKEIEEEVGNEIEFIETSALSRINIDELFELLAKRILSRIRY